MRSFVHNVMLFNTAKTAYPTANDDRFVISRVVSTRAFIVPKPRRSTPKTKSRTSYVVYLFAYSVLSVMRHLNVIGFYKLRGDFLEQLFPTLYAEISQKQNALAVYLGSVYGT